MKLIFAIGWTLILIMDIFLACNGHTPTWVSVFCPLAVLAISAWMDYLVNKNKEGK